uniref:Uncharacterized protein n=1 Tax=Globodera rostochiensis TaxID=31243 RepID=A0A914HQP9_GLORO
MLFAIILFTVFHGVSCGTSFDLDNQLLNYVERPPPLSNGIASGNSSRCVVYFDYRNPAKATLAVLPQAHAPNSTRFKDCERDCADFEHAGHEKRQWNHTCHLDDELDCKITFNWGQLSAAGTCPALYNSPEQAERIKRNKKKIHGLVHVSGLCVLFADNQTLGGYKVQELTPELTPQFGTCAQQCAKFESGTPNNNNNDVTWKNQCGDASSAAAGGGRCQIRRDNGNYTMHGNCPMLDENGDAYFGQILADLVPEKLVSATKMSAFVSVRALCLALIFGTFSGAQWHFIAGGAKCF